MSKNREDSYIFCDSLIRASERSLLTKAKLLRAAEAENFNASVAVLNEYNYGDGRTFENPRDFAGLLADEERKAFDLVLSALPDKTELEMLRCPKDYHNAKAALKAEFLEISPLKYMVGGGRFEPEAMEAMIRERDFMWFSTEMKEAVAEASELFGKGRDPQEIDIILDKACYREMLRTAEAVGDGFLIGYVRLLIDILNVVTFVRLRQIKKPWSFFRKVFLDGGSIPENLFIGGYEESYHQLADKFAPYGFREIVEKGAVKVKTDGTYSLLEKLCDNKRIEYIRDAKFVPFGLAPAAAFIIAKESECKNLRMILSGKIAGTPKAVILERLRKTYV